jgi:hypothetical protein
MKVAQWPKRATLETHEMGETQDKTELRYDLWVSLPPAKMYAHPDIAFGTFWGFSRPRTSQNVG